MLDELAISGQKGRRAPRSDFLKNQNRQPGKTSFTTKKKCACCIDKFMDELFSTRDVAQRVGVAEHHLVYALRQGYLKDVKIVAGKRLFTAADITRVRDYFEDRHKETNERRR